MFVRVSLLLLSVLFLSFLCCDVSAAGKSPYARSTVFLPEGHPTSFPTKKQLEADPVLKQKYTGANKINVHLVPHTHDDVGWLKTVEQYYYGANNTIQHAAVKYILDTVVEELVKNPARKFIYVEQAFFQFWWVRQSAAVQTQVRQLIANGQLEFVNGGWCMHDEANTHYVDMVDQTTLGHQFLLTEFSVTPTIGWQIDPFGHSATQAALLSGVVGFEGLFFGRIDHQDHDYRMMNKNMEFIWRPSPSLGTAGQVFTGAFQNGNYGPPNGFCFDWFCDDAPMIDDETILDYNIPEKVQLFLNQINAQAAFTLGTELMITMGSDFQHESSREWFQNLDKLIQYVNADGRISVEYSTPSRYVQAKNAENITFSVKTDDFFPYSDDDHAYWTGYFTSRPALKKYVRTSSALLQLSKNIEALSFGDGTLSNAFAKAVGVVQHHDAVAGTAKQHVAFDYAQKLHMGQVQSQNMISDALVGFVTEGFPTATKPEFVFCELANISVCDISSSLGPDEALQILLFNGVGRSRTEIMEVPMPINYRSVSVMDSTGVTVTSQIKNIWNMSSFASNSATQSVVFEATVPAFGYATYFLVSSPSKKTPVSNKKGRLHKVKLDKNASRKVPDLTQAKLKPLAAGQNISIGNSLVRMTFSSTGPILMTDMATGASQEFAVSFGYYQSYSGDGQKSGAYIFRPNEDVVLPLHIPEGYPQIYQDSTWTGPLTQQVVQIINSWLNITYKVDQVSSSFVEIEYTVGEIPIYDGTGKEVVLQYTMKNLASNGTWSADSNGREMIQRIRNYRSSWNYQITEPISGNYVPMNAAATLTDGSQTMTILNDRSQGVVSMTDGTLEIMVHRRVLMDDERGVGEPLNETADITPYPNFIRSGQALIITGKHYISLTNASLAARAFRPMMQAMYRPIQAVYAQQDPSQIMNYLYTHVPVKTFFTSGFQLPINLDVISLESWQQWNGRNRSFLFRIGHQFAVGEDAELSQPTSVDLNSFLGRPPSNVQEVSLTATSNLSQEDPNMPQMKWRTMEGDDTNDNVVTLNPMQIRTFIIDY